MSMGFHLDDIEEEYFNNHNNLPPIGAPYHDDIDDVEKDIPPIGAPIHD